jgi:hypothetical protein
MLNFPNRSRIFDPTRRAVRFCGHDSAMEWSFFVTEEGLKRLQPNVEGDEASLLLAFDANRPPDSGPQFANRPLRSASF